MSNNVDTLRAELVTLKLPQVIIELIIGNYVTDRFNYQGAVEIGRGLQKLFAVTTETPTKQIPPESAVEIQPLSAIHIKYYEVINQTVAMPLILAGWQEASKLDPHVGENCPINWDDSAFVAFDGPIPIGVISYQKIDWNRSLWIKQGYVEPSYRRRKIYSQLFEQLVLKAKELKLRKIDGGISPDNAPIIALCNSLGRKLYMLTYTFAIDERRDS